MRAGALETSLMRLLAVLWLSMASGVALPVHAQTQTHEAAELAEDPLVEKRLLAISEELRCLVCQNESLAGSRAELANDLRREIRSMIKEGRSDDAIMQFMVDRYGDFVRYRPPMKATTYLLWFGPFVLFGGALIGLLVYLRQRSQKRELAGVVALTDSQRQQAARLLDGNQGEQA